jgi:hypothetical protein
VTSPISATLREGQAPAGPTQNAQAQDGRAFVPPRSTPSTFRRVSRLAARYLLHPPLPLRWRIALLYTAVLGLTLLAADIAVYLSLEHYLEGEIDDNLQNQARELSGTIDLDLRRETSQTRVNVFIRFPNLDAFASPGMTVQVLNLDGRILIQSENLRDRAVPIDVDSVELAVAGTPNFATASVDGVPVRIYYAPLEPRQLEGNIAGVIQITRTLRDVNITLTWLRLLLMGIGAISLFVATAAGYLLARAALTPILWTFHSGLHEIPGRSHVRAWARRQHRPVGPIYGSPGGADAPASKVRSACGEHFRARLLNHR